VHGTLNGLGERCGNANLIALIPTLMLKMGYDTGIKPENLRWLTPISRQFDERLNRLPNRHAAYVGEAAFAHKGGLHVSAVAKDPRTYEHIDPVIVGNKRQIIVSDQAGRANIVARLKEIGLGDGVDNARLHALVEGVKQNEFKGLSYDGADASFELLARRTLGDVPKFYDLRSFRVIDERRWNARNELITLSEATVKVDINDAHHMAVAEGNGPVNALDKALRSVLLATYPCLDDMRLVDYKVRILTPNHGTQAVTRVMITSHNSEGKEWTTVGVSTNVIDASYNALQDAIRYYLLKKTAL
jgi:2-isopropylmalate synthase